MDWPLKIYMDFLSFVGNLWNIQSFEMKSNACESILLNSVNVMDAICGYLKIVAKSICQSCTINHNKSVNTLIKCVVLCTSVGSQVATLIFPQWFKIFLDFPSVGFQSKSECSKHSSFIFIYCKLKCDDFVFYFNFLV